MTVEKHCWDCPLPCSSLSANRSFVKGRGESQFCSPSWQAQIQTKRLRNLLCKRKAANDLKFNFPIGRNVQDLKYNLLVGRNAQIFYTKARLWGFMCFKSFIFFHNIIFLLHSLHTKLFLKDMVCLWHPVLLICDPKMFILLNLWNHINFHDNWPMLQTKD